LPPVTEAEPVGATHLRRAFFERPTLDCALALLGRQLFHRSREGPVGGRIVEVEAYVGADDPACHAAAGRTRRNRVMWGPAGFAYVYFTYGMHHCLNLVTEREGFGAAVLIRALEPTLGLPVLARRCSHLPRHLWLSGPGRVCAGLGVDLSHDGSDLERGPIRVGRGRRRMGEVACSVRIGIRRGSDRPWRFYLAGHPSVSGPRAARGAAGRRT
jgi:DNA-3-methyladenine glycosylase